MAPDLSTAAKRVHYASRVIQEARQLDPEFNTVYRASLNHQGVGLCGLLHDLGTRLEEP